MNTMKHIKTKTNKITSNKQQHNEDNEHMKQTQINTTNNLKQWNTTWRQQQKHYKSNKTNKQINKQITNKQMNTWQTQTNIQ